jgi:hypothetical protein
VPNSPVAPDRLEVGSWFVEHYQKWLVKAYVVVEAEVYERQDRRLEAEVSENRLRESLD